MFGLLSTIGVDPESVAQWAEIIDKYGALAIFSIVSGAFNVVIVTKIIRGTLVSGSLYKRAITESDKLRKILETERVSHMNKLLDLMSGLKPDNKRSEGE